MKVTVVPAQVTTVEDRVAGSLSFSQLIILAIPVFGGSLLFAILPPFMGFSIYKIVVIGVFTLLCGVLAIRIKGKIVLLWLAVLSRYNLRPKYYLFNKNSRANREDYPEPATATKTTEATKDHAPVSLPRLGLQERAFVYATLDDPISRLEFTTTKKGGLSVRISESQE